MAPGRLMVVVAVALVASALLLRRPKPVRHHVTVGMGRGPLPNTDWRGWALEDWDPRIPTH